MHDVKVGFVTCVKLGFECIEEIYALGGRLDVVVTLSDDVAANKSGRTFVDEFCRTHDIRLLKVRHINDDWVHDDILSCNLDWLFIVGWSQLVHRRIIEAPRLGCIGIHPTLLPQGRGRAPIPWAILKGLNRTGVTAFRIGEGTDDGPVCAQIEIPISPQETATSLYEKVCAAHRKCIRSLWPPLAQGHIDFVPQDESKATYWPRRKPEDGELTPDMTVADVDRMVRAVTRPYPGAWFWLGDRKARIWGGHITSDDVTLVKTLKLPFKDGTFIATDFEWE